jgi:hypothetical protein
MYSGTLRDIAGTLAPLAAFCRRILTHIVYMNYSIYNTPTKRRKVFKTRSFAFMSDTLFDSNQASCDFSHARRDQSHARRD